MVPADEAMELLIKDVADGRLERKPLLVRALVIRPQDPVGEFQPGGSSLGIDLEAGLWQDPRGVPPGVAMVAAEGDLCHASPVVLDDEALEIGNRLAFARTRSRGRRRQDDPRVPLEGG